MLAQYLVPPRPAKAGTSPQALNNCTAAAGLSLGEYTALVFAGALSFEDALRVVKVRAEAMQAAAIATAGTMSTVIGLDDAELEQQCAAAAELTGETVQICNFLFPKGRVIGGTPRGCDAVAAALKGRRGVMVKPVAVSGAFHTELMRPACDAVRAALAEVTVRPPRIAVLANATGEPYRSAAEIRERLVQQIVAPVLWDASVARMLEDGVGTFYDVGPRAQLKAMLRKIDRTAGTAAVSVEV